MVAPQHGLYLVNEDAYDTRREYGTDHWVNVVDAWDDCPEGVVCQRTFWYDIDCGTDPVCEGTLSVDAFLSTGAVSEPGCSGEIVLEILFDRDRP